MKRLMIIAAVGLAMAACSKSDGTTTINTANGATVTAGKAPPTNLPDFAKIYPGAVVSASLQTDHGGIVGFDTDAPPETVIDFYRQLATTAQLKESLDSAKLSPGQPGAHVITYADGVAGGKRNLMTGAEVRDGHTHVSLSYGVN